MVGAAPGPEPQAGDVHVPHLWGPPPCPERAHADPPGRGSSAPAPCAQRLRDAGPPSRTTPPARGGRTPSADALVADQGPRRGAVRAFLRGPSRPDATIFRPRNRDGSAFRVLMHPTLSAAPVEVDAETREPDPCPGGRRVRGDGARRAGRRLGGDRWGGRTGPERPDVGDGRCDSDRSHDGRVADGHQAGAAPEADDQDRSEADRSRCAAGRGSGPHRSQVPVALRRRPGDSRRRDDRPPWPAFRRRRDRRGVPAPVGRWPEGPLHRGRDASLVEGIRRDGSGDRAQRSHRAARTDRAAVAVVRPRPRPSADPGRAAERGADRGPRSTGTECGSGT